MTVRGTYVKYPPRTFAMRWFDLSASDAEIPATTGTMIDPPPKVLGYTVTQCYWDYCRWLQRKGKEGMRASLAYRRFFDLVGVDKIVEELRRADFDAYADMRVGEGANPLTARAELTRIMAGINRAKLEERIKIVPVCEMPEGVHKVRRPLTEEEFVIVMRQRMSERLRRQYVLMYWTGARARATEEIRWTWGVDFSRRVINFVPPNRVIPKNKRRVDCFPIQEEFMPMLRQWYDARKPEDDDYVIGVGPQHRMGAPVVSTYHEADHVVRELAGLTDPSLVPRHCLRKMFVTELFDKGADPEAVGALTGDNPAMLRKHYAFMKAEKLRVTSGMRSMAVLKDVGPSWDVPA